MKPLNKKERTKAFNKVVVLFAVAFIIAMILGFTTLNVNKLADSQSSNKLTDLENQIKFLDKTFAPNIDLATKTLTKIPSATASGEDSKVLHQDVAAILSSTKNMIPGEESRAPMYQNILKVYSDLRMAYENQSDLQEELADCKKGVQSSDGELRRTQDEAKRLRDELNTAKTSVTTPSTNSSLANTALAKELADTKKKLEFKTTESKLLKSDLDKCKTDLERCRKR